MVNLKKTFISTMIILLMITGCLPVAASSDTTASSKDSPLQKQPTSTPSATPVEATSTPTASPTITPTVAEKTILLAAGDIADCKNEGDEETAKILAQYPDAVIAPLGDNVYEDGTTTEFDQCYAPTWGQFKDQSKPAVGNHEYGTPDARPYFEYFGPLAGEINKGYYSYDLGSWHIIVINSNCSKVGGCKPGDPQVVWLNNDLKQHPAACTLAYWHHPRFSSGQWGNTEQMEVIWDLLYQYGAELALGGHDHSYERFKPIGINEMPDPEYGIRQFVVGTGGKNLTDIVSDRPLPLSDASTDETYGVLKLTLMQGKYAWEYLPVAEGSFTDSGEAACHPAPG